MSQTTQFVSIPLIEGSTTALIASTAWGVGGSEIKDGQIRFTAGPDQIGARYIRRHVIVQDGDKQDPGGDYKFAGSFKHRRKLLKVFVELPSK